jgi:hypothetical protein
MKRRAPDDSFAQDLPSGSTEIPSAVQTSDVHSVVPRSSSSSDGPKRNGHAAVIGRLVELALALPPGNDLPRTASLTSEDERLLRDADERQLGAGGAVLAKSGSIEEWRALLTEHFRRRYDMTVVFDAPITQLR